MKGQSFFFSLISRLGGFRAVGMKFIFGGLKRGASVASIKRGSGGLPQGKFFMARPFRSFGNAPFLKNVPLTEAKDHD